MTSANTFTTALRTTIVTLVLTGLVYPLTVTGLAQLFFPDQANGSLVRDEKGLVVGSALIGQVFAESSHFQPRPSAAGEHGYDAAASSGSNLGPTSQKLRARAMVQAARLSAANSTAGQIPVELLTTSASGLDPHLSPEAALWQVARIARARGIAPEKIAALVVAHTEGRDLGFLGEPRVNVLQLNLALTSMEENAGK
ncbi:MAG: potassium-transporting ATPase subunit KdpC [Myxococcota bacterium]